MKKYFILALTFIPLSACTNTKYVPIILCEENIKYTQEQQTQVAETLITLPSDNATITFIMDYSKIRDANNACLTYQKELNK